MCKLILIKFDDTEFPLYDVLPTGSYIDLDNGNALITNEAKEILQKLKINTFDVLNDNVKF